MRMGRHSRAISVAATIGILVAAIWPIGIQAAHLWSIATSTTSVTQHVSTGVGLTVINQSGNDGGGESIGCVRVTIPADYRVDAVAVDSVTNGYVWSASMAGTGPTVVTLQALDDNNRLRGDPDFDVLEATITVTALIVGASDWSATEWEHDDCSNEQLSATLPMTVTVGSNQAPTAGTDAYTVVAGDTLTVTAPGVLGDDGDPDGDPITATLVTDVGNGLLSLASDGSFTYTPDPGFAGTDGFTYQATDGSASSAATSVSISVTNVTPTVTDDSYVVPKNVGLTVDASAGVLANDADADPAQTLTAELVAPPAVGSLTLDGDGGFSYTPAPGSTGLVTFTYRATDGVVWSPTATATLDVQNQAPVAADDDYAVHMGLPLIESAPGVLADDTDANGDALTAQLVSGPANGVLSLSADGAFTYLPGPLFVGTDSFTYRASDGAATSLVVTVTITVGNAAPVAADDAASTSHDTIVSGNVLANDNDPNGDTISAILVSGPASGSLTFAADGAWSYLPDAGFVGTDGFTYRATDGAADSNDASVAIDVTNAVPVVPDVTVSTIHDRSTGGNVLAGASDGDGDLLTAALVSDVASGALTLDPDGSWTYLPDPGFVGTDGFTVRASDGIAGSADATITIEVTNALPVALDDSATVHHRSTLVVGASGVLDNDADADADALISALASFPAHGTVAMAADGSYTYTPTPGYVGPDSFTYVASDGIALSAPATVTIDVTNAAPVVLDDAWSTVHGRTISIAAPGVLANDTDADGDPMTVVSSSAPGHGSLTISPAGWFVYVPDGGFVGDDTFVYSVTDGALAASASVTIHVTNAVPHAGADAFTTTAGTTLNIASAAGLLINDSDADGDSLTARLALHAGHGTVAVSASGGFIYTPEPGFAGTDTFTYVVSDGLQDAAPARVRISVSAPAAVPTAAPTPTPTPTPTPEPSATPTAQPSPTATPTPEPTRTPEPPTTASGSGSGGGTDAWAIGSTSTGEAAADEFPIIGLAADTLGLFGRAFEWLVPGALVTVPGLLLLLVIAAQSLGALAWLPLVRRMIGTFGIGRAGREGA